MCNGIASYEYIFLKRGEGEYTLTLAAGQVMPAPKQMPSALHAAIAAAPLRPPNDSGVYAAAIAAASAGPSAQWRQPPRCVLQPLTQLYSLRIESLVVALCAYLVLVPFFVSQRHSYTGKNSIKRINTGPTELSRNWKVSHRFLPAGVRTPKVDKGGSTQDKDSKSGQVQLIMRQTSR